MIARVLVPLDGLAEHDAAIPVALRLAARLGAGTELVSVVDPGLATYDRAELTRLAQAYGGDASVLVLTGEDVEAQLLVQAGRADTLMCMASAGHGAIGEALLGSVSAALVRRAGRPVVLVGPACDTDLAGRELAIALDGSTYAEAILAPAIALADTLRLEPTLYHVAPTPRDHGARARAAQYLARVAKTVAPGRPLEHEVLSGRHPERALTLLGDRPAVAMLAITTHGARPFERLVGGSVAMSVVHRTTAPVLAYHPTEPNAGPSSEAGMTSVVDR